MTDKSPRKSLSKKSGKSLKEKRADKRAKLQDKQRSTVEEQLHPRKR